MVQIHVCEPAGDILVFLTGEEEIEDACKKIGKEIQQMGDQASCHTSVLCACVSWCSNSDIPAIAVQDNEMLALHKFCCILCILLWLLKNTLTH